MNMKVNPVVRAFDQAIYGEFYHSNLDLTEVYFLDEFFEPMFLNDPDPKIKEILKQNARTRGELTDFLCLNIETYM